MSGSRRFSKPTSGPLNTLGGRTREHLYDRPRTVCRPNGEGKAIWNGTFRAFADYWGFEPRLCQPYRAMTKGKVESGVKYLKRNFLPGRTFIDIVDLQAQLDEWNTTIADVRIHGTTHERPLERFERERSSLHPTAGQPSFLTDVRWSRDGRLRLSRESRHPTVTRCPLR